MINKSMVLVPSWVQNVLYRNRVPVADILDFAKMRKLMSAQDLSAFLSLQSADRIALLKPAASYHLLNSWEQCQETDGRTELVSVVVPASRGEETIDDAYSRFGPNARGITWGGEPAAAVRIIDISREAFAVELSPNFIEAINDGEVALEVLRRVLKVFYGYLDVHSVSATPIFLSYLDALKRVKGIA